MKVCCQTGYRTPDLRVRCLPIALRGPAGGSGGGFIWKGVGFFFTIYGGGGGGGGQGSEINNPFSWGSYIF